MDLKKYGAQFIPLVKGGKMPAKKFSGRTFTAEELTKHVKNGGNLGLLAQPHFLFIDIDTPEAHGNNGFDNFNQWLEKHNIDPNLLYENTLVQATPTGGFHIIMLQPENVHFKQEIKFLPGVDIKASKNNYIVVQPSRTEKGQYRFLNDRDPQVAPPALIKAMNEQVNADREKRHASRKEQIKNGEPNENGLLYHQWGRYANVDVFYTVEHGFPAKGERNNAVFIWSQTMRRLTDEETAIKWALLANKRSPEPLPKKEITSTIKSAYSFAPQLRAIAASGTEWIVLRGVSSHSNGSVLAVTLADYQANGSAYLSDYRPEQLRSASESDQGASEEQVKTIWNYQGGQE